VITRIVSNVKGFQDQTLESSHVVFLGNNGSGKSSLIHSIELALFRQVSDAAGRDHKVKHQLQNLAATGEDLSARVFFDNDTNRRWITGSTSNKADKISYTNVIQEALHALAGSSRNLMRYVLTRMEHQEEWRIESVEAHLVPWKGLLENSPNLANTVSRVLRLEALYDATLRAKKKELKEYETALRFWHPLTSADKFTPSVDVVEIQTKAKLCMEEITTNEAWLAEMRIHLQKCFSKVNSVVATRMRQHFPSHLDDPRFITLGKDSFVGFGDVVIPSGTEMIMLAIALAAAVSQDKDRPAYILPDRAYDPKTLACIMRVLRGVPDAVGVYIQSTVMPDSDEYEAEKLGWQIVRV
tara:strand:+ start:2552 stop:3616 length:1065 start_codon:yes stop_codon:yes gene_type:complete